MTNRNPTSKQARADAPRHSQAAGRKIPDKPRDCGPHVDTWPILDTEAGDAPKAKPKD